MFDLDDRIPIHLDPDLQLNDHDDGFLHLLLHAILKGGHHGHEGNPDQFSDSAEHNDC